MLILKRLYSRHLNSAKYVSKMKVDPGILHRRQAIAESETQEDASEVDFEELESDFTNVNQSHREHLRQMEAWKEKEKYLIVKRKYFTEKGLNFLTWHDKEQIRYLHNIDPEEWNKEKLSESFPALPEVIQKIVKNKWTKKNQARIASHDQSVIQHWANFKQGKLNNLPQELKEHLQKFSNRSLNLRPFTIPNDEEKIIVTENESARAGEFSEIIASYQRLQTNKSKTQNQDLLETNGIKEVATIKHKTTYTDNTLMTFKELQQRVEKHIARGKNVSEQEKLIVQETSSPTNQDLNTTIALKPEEISHIVGQKHNTNNKVGFVHKTARDMSHLIYPEIIVIPKKHYKRGYTYKLNDCYYDSDGEFLYRVPGMS